MPGIYLDEADAFRRVAQLRHSGIWPGVVARADGTFALTYDPEAVSAGG